jgi:hypothetical protein
LINNCKDSIQILVAYFNLELCASGKNATVLNKADKYDDEK